MPDLTFVYIHHYNYFIILFSFLDLKSSIGESAVSKGEPPSSKDNPVDKSESSRNEQLKDGSQGPVGSKDGVHDPPSMRDNLREPSGSREDLRGPSDSRDDIRGPSGPSGPRDDFRGPSGSRDDFRGPSVTRDDFRGSYRDDFRGSSGSRDDFRGSSRDDFRGACGPRGEYRDEYRGPAGRGLRGPRDREDYRGPAFRDDPPRDDDKMATLTPMIEHDWGHRGPSASFSGRAADRWDGPPVAGPPGDFPLLPTTVVDYGHRPVGGSAPAAAPAPMPLPPPPPEALEPVATFDYGHGGHGSVSRPSPPRSPPPPSWRERERWDRDKDREWDQRDTRFRERDHSWEREERDRFGRDRRNDRRDRFEDDRFDRFNDRSRNGGPRWKERELREQRERDRRRRPSPTREPPPAPPPPSVPSVEVTPAAPRPVLIEDLLCPPGRASRPANMVIILRGPPGSGKSFLAKLIKDKEVEMGGATPRMLSLDDYFVTEVEKEERDPESGRRVKTKVCTHSLILTFLRIIFSGCPF